MSAMLYLTSPRRLSGKAAQAERTPFKRVSSISMPAWITHQARTKPIPLNGHLESLQGLRPRRAALPGRAKVRPRRRRRRAADRDGRRRRDGLLRRRTRGRLGLRRPWWYDLGPRSPDAALLLRRRGRAHPRRSRPPAALVVRWTPLGTPAAGNLASRFRSPLAACRT